MTTTQSTTWSFTTNYPPQASNPSPSDGATKIDITLQLRVDVSDNDEDTVDVSFYNATDNSLIGTVNNFPTDGTASVLWPGLVEGTIYYWYVVVDDGMTTTQSTTWSFTTNYPPNAPSNPTPSDGATGVSLNPTLSVLVTDPDGGRLDVEFYNASDHSLLGIHNGVWNGTIASISLVGLNKSTTYSWYVVIDDGMTTTQSTTWTFTTTTSDVIPSVDGGGDGDGDGDDEDEVSEVFLIGAISAISAVGVISVITAFFIRKRLRR